MLILLYLPSQSGLDAGVQVTDDEVNAAAAGIIGALGGLGDAHLALEVVPAGLVGAAVGDDLGAGLGQHVGDAIKTHDRIMFYQVRPEDGVMEEKDHELLGRSISQKVLLFPGGKGSSVVQQDGLYHLDRFHNMPAALIVQDPDPVLVAGAIIMEIPMVDRLPQEFYDAVKDGDQILVNADEGYVEVL